MSARARGFTLVEVLVALVIVAFGMGAVLASLNSAASNIAALREKSLAQWVALNLVADARLALQAPTQGNSSGEVDNFGGGNWQWQQSVTPLAAVPGMLQIVVQVKRSTEHPFASSSSSSGVTTQRSLINSGSTLSSSHSLMSSSGGSFLSSSSGSFLSRSASSGSSSGSSSGVIGLGALTNDKNQSWTATVIGFRGDAVAAASGDNNPNWDGTSVSTASSSSSGSSGGGAVMPNFTLGGSSGGTSSSPVTQQGGSAGAN